MCFVEWDESPQVADHLQNARVMKDQIFCPSPAPTDSVTERLMIPWPPLLQGSDPQRGWRLNELVSVKAIY